MRASTSSIVRTQVPDFVREDYPTFVAFVEAYYEYLDNQGVDLSAVRDIDRTLDSFIEHFKKELAIHLPVEVNVDERFLLKYVKDQYLAKGSEGSFKLLFRLLYNKNVNIFYPGRSMLRASDGRWNQDISIFVKVFQGTPDMIDGRLVDIIKPNTVIKVLVDRRQYVEIEVNRVVLLSDDIYEIFIDRKYFGNIDVGDVIRYKELFGGTIVATTSKVTVLDGGTGFKAGQLFEVRNGEGSKSVVKVTRVDQDTGKILNVEFIKFGINYRTDFTVSINSSTDYYATENEAILSSVIVDESGNISPKDATRGNAEQGYISKVDYVIDNTIPIPATNFSGWLANQYMNGTYVGETLREFSAQPVAAIVYETLKQPALLSVNLGPLAKYPGYYSSNNGFLSDAMFVQDSRYYQSFSYVLQIDERLSTYKTAVRTMVHPAGTALFGEFQIQNNFDIGIDLTSLVKSLALSLKEKVTPDDTDITFLTTKVLADAPVIDDLFFIKDMALVRMDYLDTPEDYAVKEVGKALSDATIGTLEDSTTLNTGKALSDDTIGTLEDSTILSTGKALADSAVASEEATIMTDKYLQDTTIGTFVEEGYLARNPYSEGGYFAITPIIYDNTIEQTF